MGREALIIGILAARIASIPALLQCFSKEQPSGIATPAKRYFTPFGIQVSSFATSDFAAELTGMPQKSKNGPRFLFTIFE